MEETDPPRETIPRGLVDQRHPVGLQLTEGHGHVSGL
jgi:hypothetical protein